MRSVLANGLNLLGVSAPDTMAGGGFLYESKLEAGEIDQETAERAAKEKAEREEQRRQKRKAREKNRPLSDEADDVR